MNSLSVIAGLVVHQSHSHATHTHTKRSKWWAYKWFKCLCLLLLGGSSGNAACNDGDSFPIATAKAAACKHYFLMSNIHLCAHANNSTTTSTKVTHNLPASARWAYGISMLCSITLERLVMHRFVRQSNGDSLKTLFQTIHICIIPSKPIPDVQSTEFSLSRKHGNKTINGQSRNR